MATQQAAQYVPEPFRSKLANAIERGYALSPSGICEMFSVSRATVHNALHVGDLPGFRLGASWRVRPEKIPARLAIYWASLKKQTLGPAEIPSGELVYFLEGAPGFVKIGYTKNLAKRLKALQTGCSHKLSLLVFARGGPSVERDYHMQFRAWRIEGEWFRLDAKIRAEIARLNETIR